MEKKKTISGMKGVFSLSFPNCSLTLMKYLLMAW
jgi:hypothetical protein